MSEALDCNVDRGAVAATRLSMLRDLGAIDGMAFADWLGAAARGSRRRALWDLLTVATCNLPATELSAAVGAFVVREGFLHGGAAPVGVPAAGLSRLLDPAHAALAARDGAVRLGDTVHPGLIAARPAGGGPPRAPPPGRRRAGAAGPGGASPRRARQPPHSGRARPRCGPAPAPRSPAWPSPARGPRPAGRSPWRAPPAAARRPSPSWPRPHPAS